MATEMRCNRCHRPMKGTTAYDGACECGGLIEAVPPLTDTRVYVYLGEYRYRIKSMGGTSQRYGNCEVCREPVADVHYQVEQHRCTVDEDTFYTEHACRGLFGHESCLLGARRE